MEDLKEVRMMVGTSVMEGLARANKQSEFCRIHHSGTSTESPSIAYFHPLILTIYIVTALALDYHHHSHLLEIALPIRPDARRLSCGGIRIGVLDAFWFCHGWMFLMFTVIDVGE
jgi:hypothetical protein